MIKIESPTIKAWHPLDSAPEPPEPTAAQLERRRRYALTLCVNAQNAASWALADKMAARFGCESCQALGVQAPDDGQKLDRSNVT